MNRDFVAGSALLVAGSGYAIYAATTLPLGTFRQMGAGMFPVALGILLAGFGICIAVPALFRGASMPEIRPRAFVAIIASIVGFAVLIRSAGLLAAVPATTICASLAAPGRRVKTVVLLCAVLLVLTWTIFVLLLDLPIPVIRMPF
ncbi:tripartite tricarboxylate transporter TctB family protein [Frigidibacter sp. ROC022]|uniref:tripartite tricarboxylate transporter TctB family protein n=1 Tax=Frigidibacter sp. ROC022 TaxID=2971796 RepID=UPI00215A3AD7|nr:tripartite tricarboxylate transporter TctB family protein [Frigidibacter sp. ROC022]MCR8724521.1 tripartite tricarboxylate transporter TctB family protein [Frigidibacter sp. ROC022]